jgi:hypothetical protein
MKSSMSYYVHLKIYRSEIYFEKNFVRENDVHIIKGRWSLLP